VYFGGGLKDRKSYNHTRSCAFRVIHSWQTIIWAAKNGSGSWIW